MRSLTKLSPCSGACVSTTPIKLLAIARKLARDMTSSIEAFSGISTPVDAKRAEITEKFSCGGVSNSTTSYWLKTGSSASLMRLWNVVVPSLKLSATSNSYSIMSMDAGIRSTVGKFVLRMISAAGSGSSDLIRSYEVGISGSSSGVTPNRFVRLAWLSRSISKTRYPRSPNSCPMCATDDVLAEPPFRLNIVKT